MSQTKDEKHLSTLLLRQKGLEGPPGRRLNHAASPAVDPERLVKLSNKQAAIHEPGAMAGPPENSCREWNLDQTPQSTIPR